MDDCDGSIPVARIKEEKQAVQVEREELLTNFEQHQQLEKQQQEEKRKVQPMVHCFFPGGRVQSRQCCFSMAIRIFLVIVSSYMLWNDLVSYSYSCALSEAFIVIVLVS